MRATLRLRDDELAVDELDRLSLESSDVDQFLVLHASPALRGGACCMPAAWRAAPATVNASRWRRLVA